jgi:hypothetical protein
MKYNSYSVHSVNTNRDKYSNTMQQVVILGQQEKRAGTITTNKNYVKKG